MAGSMKVTCPIATRAWAFTAPFATLNAQSLFTFSGWFQVVSVGSGAINADFIAAVTSYTANISVESPTQFGYHAESAGDAKDILNLPIFDFKGHFVVISYNATGTTTIYVDGSPVQTLASMGATAAVNQVMQIGFNAAGPAITLYLKDVAIWGGYAATQADVIALRDGVSTPATLATPATNWWTLRDASPTGQAVTTISPGMHDQIGSVPLGGLTVDAGASLTYDAFEIALSFSTAMMAPFTDVTGNAIYIPLYKDPTTTTGGFSPPQNINVVPVWKLNGSVITPTLIPLDINLYAFVYQMPSGTTLLATDVLTMSAPLGWASTNAGIVQGTSSNGSLPTPLTVQNNVGQPVEPIYAVGSKPMKIGYNASAFGNADNSPATARANWVSKIEGGTTAVPTWTGGLTYHANGLPATITGTAGGVILFDQANMVDANGTPGIEGLWTLAYGDSSSGVTSSAPNQVLEMTFNASWSIVRTVVSAGTWTGSAWTGIVKTYKGTYAPSGGNTGFNAGLGVTITSGNGNVDFPSKGNGQVEFGVFPPSPTNRLVSSPINWDPMGIDPEYLLKLAGAKAIRWMADIHGFQFDGESMTKTVADLSAYRLVNDMLWSTGTTITTNVISAAPIGATFNAFIDYLGTTLTMSADNWNKSSLYSQVPMLLTTDAPHGLRTGDFLILTGVTNVPQPVIRQDGLKVATALNATDNPVTFTTDSACQSLVGDVVLIDSEQLTITGVLNTSILVNASVTATRGTSGTTLATHSIGAPVYVNFLTSAASSGATTLTLSRTGFPFGLPPTSLLQIDSEQVQVVTLISTTSVTVTRAVNGTTAASHAVGALVSPVISLDTRNTKVSPMVIDSTHFVIAIGSKYLPIGFATPVSNPTLAGTTTFTAPNQPSLALRRPINIGSVPYEFAAKVTNAIAVQNGFPTTLWINTSTLSTDALVTEIIANRTIPFLTTTNVNVVLQIGNELWNTSGTGFLTTNLLSITAPNPDTPSGAFTSGTEWTASRQNHVNNLAKAAFTAAGLNPNRVANFQAGQHQLNPSQNTSQALVSYCQLHNIPIDLMTIDGYVDISTPTWNLWWTWMPTGDGGSASWNRATARRMMMSHFRAWCWFSQYLAGGILGNVQLLSWYKAGKLVSANGVGSSNANTGNGKLCYYESATEFITGGAEGQSPEPAGKTAFAGNFLHPNAMEHDLTYDGIPQWAGDTGWLATETAYIAAKQSAAAMIAALMPSASFPDQPSATPAFSCIFQSVGNYGQEGEAWLIYNWQGQQPGTGTTNTMGWSATTPTAQDHANVSVRGQAAINWIGTPTPTPTSSGGAALLMGG